MRKAGVTMTYAAVLSDGHEKATDPPFASSERRGCRIRFGRTCKKGAEGERATQEREEGSDETGRFSFEAGPYVLRGIKMQSV
jgi:hypothetical protein